MVRTMALSQRDGERLGLTPHPRRQKFGVRMDPAGVAARTVDGIVFDSRREAERWKVLTIWQHMGQISSLKRQQVFPLEVNGVTVGAYRADFCYRDAAGALVVEDVKGTPTARLPIYRMKKKLMLACNGVTVIEV